MAQVVHVPTTMNEVYYVCEIVWRVHMYVQIYMQCE